MNYFTLFRIALGSYLTVHFAQLFPYAEELFGAGAPSLAIAATALSVLLTLDIGRRTCSLLLWMAWAAFFNLNYLISNPGLPYVGLLLLLSAATPGKGNDVKLSPVAFWGATFLLAAGYTFSGILKLGSPSWIDGTALLRVAENPLARPGAFQEFFVSLPLPLLKLMTWGSLALEIAALPMLLHQRTRAISWICLVGMHLGIICLMDFADLTLGMLLIHLFVFDRRWWSYLQKWMIIPAKTPPSNSLGLERGNS